MTTGGGPASRATSAEASGAPPVPAAASPRAHADGPPPRLPDSQHFAVDPVVDGLLIVGGGTFDVLLGLILSTGEIKPQAPSQDARDKLLAIDRSALTQTIDQNANT